MQIDSVPDTQLIARSEEDCPVARQRMAIILFLCLGLYLLFCTAQAQHFHMLPALQVLQENLPTISKAYRVAKSESFQGLLYKNHFFNRSHAQSLLQILGDVLQKQAGTRWYADRR